MTEPAAVRPTRDLPAAALIAAALFVVYALGASRTVYVGDSGELVAAVHTLGIPHPPGYPLYVLLGKLWTVLLPFGSIAWRMSLFSALAAALACAGLYTVARRLGLGRAPALFAALVLAFSPSFWGEANVQTVYALNALLLVTALRAAVEWRRSADPRWWIGALFLCGLGASNRIYMGVFGALLAAYGLLTDRAVRRPRRLLAAAAAFVAGLLPYAYLPLRSRADPRLDWGDPETLSGFLAVVTRKEFWGRSWIERPADVLAIGSDYLTGIGQELLWIGLALALVGALVGRRRGWPVGLLLGGMAVNFAMLALHGSRTDLFVWHRYYIPSYLLAALLGGLGCKVLLERLPPRARLVPLVLPLALLLTGWRDTDRSRYRIAEAFSEELLATLPPGARLIANDDNILFVLIYLQLVEGARPDVDLILEGVSGEELPDLHFDPDVEPLFLTHHPNWDLPQLELVPIGLVFQTVRAGRPRPAPAELPPYLDGENDTRVPKDYLTQNLLGHFHYMIGVSHETLDWPRAQAEFVAAQDAAPDNDVLFYNLGLIYRRNGLYTMALAAFEHSDAINPRHLASAQKARARDRIVEVEAEIERLRAAEASLDEHLAGEGAGSAQYHLEGLGDLAGAGEGAAEAPTTTTAATRNLASVHFQAGRYEEALELYRGLVDEDPKDGALRSSLAGVLGALGRYEEAKRELREALVIDPLSVEAYHNLGVIHERLGETDLAIEAYREGLRYFPQYEPSRHALSRLTGSNTVRRPLDERERQAVALADRASLAARRTDYAEAMRLLDQAEALAPGLALVHQYRSNVAYLMGDVDAGIAALERALELEPDNELFKANLEKLRRQKAGESPRRD